MTTYSFKDVKAAIVGPGGAFALGDGAGVADEGITVTMEGDKTTTITGADGALMHSLHASRLGLMALHYLKTSPINALLNQLYNSQEISSSLWGQNQIVVVNPATGDVITGVSMAFVKHPDIVYAKDGNNNSWELRGLVTLVLGNGSAVAT